MNKKFVIIATVFIDVLGMGIIIPTLPFYVESFGVSAFTITMLFSVFAFFSFFSAPIIGSWSDKIGRRPVMILSICSTALGWLVFASAHSILFLFIGRIIDGLAAGNFSTAQSYLTDIAKNEQERTKNLGIIGAVFGTAFVLGPAIGGLLSQVSPTFPFWFVGALATLNAINAYFNLPESHLNKNSEHRISLNPLAPIIRIVKEKKFLISFIVWFLFGLAVSMQQSIFALYLDKVFNYGASAAGIFMTAVGVIIILNQAWLLPKFWLKKFKERDLEIFMTAVFAIGFLLSASSSLSVFIFGLLGITFAQSVLRVVFTSQIAGQSGDRKGEILGALTGMMSLAMIIGPLTAGALFTTHHTWPFIISGLLSLIAFVILYQQRRQLTKFDQTIQPLNDQTIV
ncbi:hypothetical protein COT94_02565 [Candidatus Falkowbacteria bacterium CG10_big_fil_rev_8_21_14_0_10_37_14]|uniref:Major facilitator superfamily (MFS) profile domain-containing protein n=1 Tax=Candidatus Falkowbacteria bacterium CG10_big_fil_rev_8_21_14_0_10_37_14 TaxID=1974561 RepID=A0A2M6WTS6_9BACT|nr:TCR/Tet family MFS transporter [Candidatus Falkowbacteria bacterium]PIT96116.1 MAG: hypothetical protein COT94_02565 [Candidatus Falkowbacteria bacterium CG10_big_fil_rev_8_21_14_0_10_37_14]